jgi:hypothetical protein
MVYVYGVHQCAPEATFRMPFQKGWGNGLTNQNRLGTLPIPFQTVSDTIDMAFWD